MRVAIIGAGRQGHRRAKAIIECRDAITVAVDVSKDLAMTLAKEYGCSATTDWKAAVKDKNVDAVMVCTPNDTHAAIAISALKAGKHVLCEKPMARNLKEGQDMMAAQEKSKSLLKCGFNLRYHPAIMRAREHISTGGIGKLMFMRCRYGNTSRANFENDWRTNLRVSGGGELMDQGLHVLDLFRWFGGDISEVSGYTDTLYWKIKPVEDNAFALLRGKAGHMCMMHVSWTEWKNVFAFEAFGDSGYVKVEGLGGSYGTERLIMGSRDFAAPFLEKIDKFRGDDKSFYREWKDFSLAVRGKASAVGSAEDGLATIKLVHSIYKSSKSGRSIRL